MHEELHNLLNAYLDDELRGMKLNELERHLAACEKCRAELEELRSVSSLLRSAPLPQVMPVERFVSNLSLGLARRELRDRPARPAGLAWWLVPAGLLGAWFFVRTVFMLSGLVSAAGVTGLLGNGTAWMGGVQQTYWYEAVMNLAGAQAGSARLTLSALNDVSIFGVDLLTGFLWQAGIVLFYWAWLAVWWLQRSPRPVKNPVVSVRS
jgi:anti-sigma factor RsiW